MQKEIWKDIPEYEGIYQVSNLGNVKSLPRKNYSKYGVLRFLKGKVLANRPDGSGYFMVYLCKKGIMKSFKIHQLVASIFLSHIPNGNILVVNHKNFNRSDNRLDNLNIVTMRENGNQEHIKSSSKYVGVGWDKSRNKWTSKIWINGKTKNLGRFVNEYDAHLAYQKELSKL